MSGIGQEGPILDPVTVRRWGQEAGLRRVGFAQSGPARTGEAFRAWLDRGDAAGMSYLARSADVRADPTARFPWMRTVIVGAVAYAADGPGPAEYRVARYAHGRDYHKVLGRALRGLSRRLAAAGARSRGYVDTGPFLERDWAAAAGLGWIGKNTQLLSVEDGMWLLLGIVATDATIAPDRPAEDRCGTCTACLDACPTGALPEPYRLDARRCISYWTIEHRGDVSDEVARTAGDRLFGCDDCLKACPWNRRAAGGPPAEIVPRPASAWPSLAEVADLDEAGYRAMAWGTPLTRARREGLRRNASAVRPAPVSSRPS